MATGILAVVMLYLTVCGSIPLSKAIPVRKLWRFRV